MSNLLSVIMELYSAWRDTVAEGGFLAGTAAFITGVTFAWAAGSLADDLPDPEETAKESLDRLYSK